MSPFDSTRFNAPSKGLEIVVLRLSEVLHNNPPKRIDSTYFRRKNIDADRKLRSRPHSTIAESAASVLSFGAYALTNNFDYKESGIPFLRCANIKSGFVSFADCLYIDGDAHALLSKSTVEPETVLLTMSGSVGSAAVALPTWSYPINSNQDVAKIRANSVDPYYLAAFLGSTYGQLQIKRLPVGSVQQHLFLWMIESMVVGRLTPSTEERIGNVARAAYDARECAIQELASAQSLLEAALGLESLSGATPSSYIAMASTVAGHGRLDAEFFAPRISQLISRLGSAGLTIGDVAPARRETFNATSCGSVDYIEIGDVSGDGVAGGTTMRSMATPSRARWYVRPADVITSTVRPIRRLSALIEDHQNGSVCSSGFIVLRPSRVRSEMLLVYLRLPAFCELMDLFASASMYPAISERDLLSLPFAPVDRLVEDAICNAVSRSRNARRRAEELLCAAKRAVEIAIDEGEASARRFVDEAVS